MWRYSAFCGLCLAFVQTSSALAADLGSAPVLSLKDEPVIAPRLMWTGFYAGINGGYGWSDNSAPLAISNDVNGPYATGPLHYDLDADGAFGGAQIGYNLQSRQFVLGIEADIQLSDVDGGSNTNFAPPIVYAFNYRATNELNWFGTVRGRIGYAWDRTLIYATGGFAFGETDYRAKYLIPQNDAYANLKHEETRTGYVLGGGLEHKLDSRWSLKAEYQFIDLGDVSTSAPLFFENGTPSGETVRTNIDNEFHTIRVGLNYRLN